MNARGKEAKAMDWKLFRKKLAILFSVAATGAVCIYIGVQSSSSHGWWQAGTLALSVAILGTIIPIIWCFMGFATLLPPGDWFDTSEELAQYRTRLESHYSRITGTLTYWKTKAAAHQRLYFAQVIWASLTGVTLPVLIQIFETSTEWPTIFLTILTTWNGILLVLAFTLNSRELYRGFRQQESDFYDESRRLLNEAVKDDPELDEKVEKYIRVVASIRLVGRRVETGTPPSAIDR